MAFSAPTRCIPHAHCPFGACLVALARRGRRVRREFFGDKMSLSKGVSAGAHSPAAVAWSFVNAMAKMLSDEMPCLPRGRVGNPGRLPVRVYKAVLVFLHPVPAPRRKVPQKGAPMIHVLPSPGGFTIDPILPLVPASSTSDLSLLRPSPPSFVPFRAQTLTGVSFKLLVSRNSWQSCPTPQGQGFPQSPASSAPTPEFQTSLNSARHLPKYFLSLKGILNW